MSIHQFFPKHSEGSKPYQRSLILDCEVDPIVSLDVQMKDAEKLANQLNVLLKNYDSLLKLEDVCDHVTALREWSEIYRNGLLAAEEISRNDNTWITDLGSRLKLEADELSRIENEGGPPVIEEQRVQTEALMEIYRKIDQLIPILERQFGELDSQSLPTQL